MVRVGIDHVLHKRSSSPPIQRKTLPRQRRRHLQNNRSNGWAPSFPTENFAGITISARAGTRWASRSYATNVSADRSASLPPHSHPNSQQKQKRRDLPPLPLLQLRTRNLRASYPHRRRTLLKQNRPMRCLWLLRSCQHQLHLQNLYPQELHFF